MRLFWIIPTPKLEMSTAFLQLGFSFEWTTFSFYFESFLKDYSNPTFVHVKKGADSMTCSVQVIKAWLPQRRTRKWVQHQSLKCTAKVV